MLGKRPSSKNIPRQWAELLQPVLLSPFHLALLEIRSRWMRHLYRDVLPWTSGLMALRLARTLQASREFTEASRTGKDQCACAKNIITYIYLFNLTYVFILQYPFGLGWPRRKHTHWIKTCTTLTEFSTGHVDPSHLPKAHGPRSSISPANQKHYICIHIVNISRLHFCQSTVYQVKWPVCVSLKMMQPGRLLWCIINQKYILAYFT